jgi:putative PIG3 family NAD(P)H quinone oxidoreductase
MRAIIVSRPGGADVLGIRERPDPVPARGEVCVRVRAFGINHADLLQRRGLYPAPSDCPQDIPGLEYAGEIAACGGNSHGVAVGDRVMGIVGGGAYAEYVLSPASHIIPIPPGWSYTDAAAVPEAFITAHDALERARVSRGTWVLVRAVGSGVGTAAVQLIRARQALSIGTSRTSAKLAQASALGMEVGIDTRKEDLVAAVRTNVSDGVPAAVDLIGGPEFTQTLDAMALRGRVVLVGLTAGSRAEVDLALILRKRLTVEGTVLRSRSTAEKTTVVQAFRNVVVPLFTAQRVRPVVDRVFPFEQTPESHAYLETTANFGKVVVEVT